MKYFFINPIKKQYLMPERFSSYEIFKNFYFPYSSKAKIFWFFWKSSHILRFLLRVKKIENYLPVNIISKHIGNEYIVAFNRGNPGVEQKLSIIGINPFDLDKVFFKIATSTLSKINLENEAKALKKLKDYEFIPNLIYFKKSKKYSILKTEVFDGNRLDNNLMNNKILQLLIIISNQKVNSGIKNNSNLKFVFSHGDFCPWNLIICQNKIKVFDWEMSGLYTLGYDLFTYIFQPALLVENDISTKKILSLNKNFIRDFFKNFGIINYKPYLTEFINHKIKYYEKINTNLHFKYKKLIITNI